MYYGEKSLKALYLYHLGYDAACHKHGIVDEDWFHIPADFHDWAAHQCGFRESTSGWYNMIRSVCDSEEEAFDLFFVFFEEFRARKARMIARIHKHHSDKMIDLVSYTDKPGFFTSQPDELGRTSYYPDVDSVEVFKPGRIEILDQRFRGCFRKLDWTF